MSNVSDEIMKKFERQNRKKALKAAIDKHNKETGDDVLSEVFREEREKPAKELAREYAKLVKECEKEGEVTAGEVALLKKAEAPKNKKRLSTRDLMVVIGGVVGIVVGAVLVYYGVV